jgi:hypothetical protein
MMYRQLAPDLRSGAVRFVVMDDMSRRVLSYNATIRRIVNTRYCAIQSSQAVQLYSKTHATLYEYGDCRPDRHPNLTAP